MDIETEPEPPTALPSRRPPRKRTGWLKRALGLGALALVLAGAFWQWYRPVEKVSLDREVVKPIPRKAPSRAAAIPPAEVVSKRETAIVPLVNKVSPDSVAGKVRPVADLPRPAPQMPARINASTTGDTSPMKARSASEVSTTIGESSDLHKAPPPKTKTGTADVRTEYPYSILLASFRSLVLAEKALSNYQRKGFPVYRVTVNLGEDGIWHRLFAGYFEHFQDAEDFIEERRLDGALVKRTRFAARLGMFQSTAVVSKMLGPLKEKGFSPYIIDDDTQHRLLVGAFYTEEGAVQQVAELANSGFLGKVVER